MTFIIFHHKKETEIYYSPLPEREEIEEKYQMKYLGKILDKKLLIKHRIGRARNNITTVLKILYPLMRRNSEILMENDRTLCKTLLRPILTYGCKVWNNISDINIKKLKIIQEKFHKTQNTIGP